MSANLVGKIFLSLKWALKNFLKHSIPEKNENSIQKLIIEAVVKPDTQSLFNNVSGEFKWEPQLGTGQYSLGGCDRYNK